MPTTFVDQSGATPGTALSAANLNGLVQGLTASNLSASAGIVAGQIASVNGSALLKGLRQLVLCTQSNDSSASSTTSAAWPGTWSPTAQITTAGSSALRVRLSVYGVCSANLNLRFYIVVNGVTYNAGACTWVNPNRGLSTHVIQTATLPAGTYTVGVNYDVNTGTATCNASSDPTNQRAVLEIEEIA